MLTADPMKQQDDFLFVGRDVSNDLLNENPDNPLLQSHVGCGRVPNCREVLGETQQNLFVGNGWNRNRCIELQKSALQCCYLLQSTVPARLKFCCHEPIVRINCFISSSRKL